MSHYQQRFIINALPAQVYAALTTSRGLQGWWTSECDVANQGGDTIKFRFGGTHKSMRIERLDLDHEVRWLCIEAFINHDQLVRKDEWVGTEIVFRLSPAGGKSTQVEFEHRGLTPALECYELCNNGWQYFLDSLQAFAETGKGTPYESGEKCEEKTAIASK